MATSLSDQALIASDADWQRRVTQAATAAAIAIMGESPAGKGAEETKKRQNLADKVLGGQGSVLRAFATAAIAHIAPDPSTQVEADILDATLVTAISSIWNDMAGVRQADET